MRKTVIKKIIMWLVALYVFIIVGTYVFQKYIIFLPKKLNTNYEFVFENSFEELFLKTKDSIILNALIFKTELPRKGLVIYFHGNADNLQRWGKYHIDFTSRGYDILMMDFRGYGKSEGTPHEKKYYEDAQLMYDWAIKEKYKKEEIIIYGRSLGCGIASHLATQVEFEKLILETPFYNIRDVFQKKTLILFLPFDLKYIFPNNEFIQKIKQEVIIFAGSKDRVVPNRSTEKLKPLLKPSDRYIIIEGAGHKNLNTFEKYHTELDLILK